MSIAFQFHNDKMWVLLQERKAIAGISEEGGLLHFLASHGVLVTFFAVKLVVHTAVEKFVAAH